MHPNPIPQEPGCLVRRVTKPETAFDKFHSTTWTCVVWLGGAAWKSGRSGPKSPTLEDLIISLQTMPMVWTAF